MTNSARIERHKASRLGWSRVVDEHVEAMVAVVGLVVLLILAGLSPNPEIGVVLQAGGVGGAVGLLVAWARHRDEADADRWRTVAAFSLIGLAAGAILVLAEQLIFG